MYISIITALVAIVAVGIPSVYAGGPRHDYDEAFENVPGSPECWTDGFDDGANDRFDQDRAEECVNIPGNQYQRAYDLAIDICNNDETDDDGGDCEKVRNDNYSQQGELQETLRYVGDPETGFYREDGFPIDTDLRPAINPDFAPDESCDLKWDLKCIPGSQQECPGDYSNFEVNVCTPRGCPEGYHDNHEDEDAKCHSNEKDCPQDLVLVKDVNGDQCEPATEGE